MNLPHQQFPHPVVTEACPLGENPLLPDAELRSLLALTKRCAKLDGPARATGKSSTGRGGTATVLPSRAALLSATALQLRPGDLLLPEVGDDAAASLAPVAKPRSNLPASDPPGPLLPALGRSGSRLMLAAAMAAALKGSGTDRVVLFYGRADVPEPDWAAALRWAQTSLLPLVLVCGDARGSGAFRASARAREGAFTWEAVNAAARKLQLPILSADGEDAVAMYRVTQESILRARAGGGPAILWAMLPSTRDLAASRPVGVAPLRRLERYLRARKISLT